MSMLVKNTQEISKEIENSNLPTEIKELVLAKVLDESIPSLLPETKLDLDNKPHYDEHQWNVLKTQYKSDFEVGQERVTNLFDTAEKNGISDIPCVDIFGVLIDLPLMNQFRRDYHHMYRPTSVMNETCLVKISDIYIFRDGQRITDLIACLEFIVRTGFYDFKEAQAIHCWESRVDGKIRVSDGLHRIVMAWLCGLEYVYVEKEYHDVGLTRKEEQEVEAMSYVEGNEKRNPQKWYNIVSIKRSFPKDTEDYRKANYLHQFILDADVDIPNVRWNVESPYRIPISKTMAGDIIKNGDEDKMPSKKPGKTEHHDFWRTYEDLIPAIELYKDTHENETILVEEIKMLARFLYKIRNNEISVSLSDFINKYKEYTEKNPGNMTSGITMQDQEKLQTLDYDVVKMLKLLTGNPLQQLRRKWNPAK